MLSGVPLRVFLRSDTCLHSCQAALYLLQATGRSQHLISDSLTYP